MSRKVDPYAKNLSDDDKRYLIQRAQMPTDVMSVADQRKLVDPEQNVPGLEDRANTGDVNTANLSVEQLEQLLKDKRAEAEAVNTKELFGSRSGAPDEDDDDDDEGLTPPYDVEGNTKKVLIAELDRRNRDRDEDDQLSLAGNRAELIARLEEDDESDDEDEGE